MNKNILTALAALLIGIGVGWLLKPGPDSTEDPTITDKTEKPKTRSKPSTSTSRSRIEPSGLAKSPRSRLAKKDLLGDEERTSKLEGILENVTLDMGSLENRLRDQMSKSQDDQLNRLTELLSLSDEQREQLKEKFYDPARELSSKALEPGGTDPVTTPPPDLAGTLNEILSEDQKASYREHIQTQRRRRDESRALRKLSELTFLDLLPEQRTSAYDVLYQEAAERPQSHGTALGGIHIAEGTASVSRVVSISTTTSTPEGGILRIDGAPEEVTGGALQLFSPGAKPADTPEAIQARQEKIDADVSRFDDVFSPEQSEQYRAHLEQKQAGAPFFSGPRFPPLPE